MPPFIYNKRIILASSSPRRKQILEIANIYFDVVKPTISEEYPFQLQSSKVPEYLAQSKAKQVYETTRTHQIILAADTLVFLNDHIIGKPNTREEAIEILKRLSGQLHTVTTGVALYWKDKCLHFSEMTNVEFYPLHVDEIIFYVDHYRPYDKAGGYSVSEWLGLYGIKKIDGDYYNILGLPIARTMRNLLSFAETYQI